MSGVGIDEIFQLLIRSGAAVAWIVVAYRYRHLSPPRHGYGVAVMSLCLLVTVIALGGWLSAFDLVPGEAIRVAYTATTVVLLIAALAVFS